MPGRFVLVTELNIIKYTLRCYFNVLTVKYAGQVAKFFVIYFLVDHNNSIVQIAAFDQVMLQQHFKLMQKTEGAAGSNFGNELTDR